ncbi:MAG: hypothetical protein ACK5LC_18545 [Coprobacillaceae bacterium]
MMKRNNNKKVIMNLAMSSIKYNKLRNFFIVFTIALSVTLLMVMGLFTFGHQKNKQRAVENVQHAIYYELSDKQINNLIGEEDIEMLVLSKSGTGIEINNKILQPIYFE